MLAEKNQDIDSAVSYVYPLTEEWLVREQMIRREEFLINQQADKDTIKQQDGEIRELKGKLQKKENQLQKKENQLQKKENQLQEKENQLQKKDEQLREKDELIARLLAQSNKRE